MPLKESPAGMLKNCFQEEYREAGCDEAGRGCLAGPVFAAAVILPPDFYHEKLDDSKKMTRANRDKLRSIIEKEAIAWSVAQVSAERIDRINILNASFEAMTEAVLCLKTQPGFLLIDGHMFRSTLPIKHKCIVKGDSKYLNIAAASVLAKTHRDEYMCSIARLYPQYEWENNKGYGTLTHRRAIIKFGISPYHRRTFSCDQDQLSLFPKVTI